MDLTERQQEILECIAGHLRRRGYPPSVREIGEAVGLASPSTVHTHLNTLEERGYIRRDPTKPRAIELLVDPDTGVGVDRRPTRYVPLVGDVAAGTDVLAVENTEEMVPLPADLTGDGELFMLRVRGESMIGDGILDGDLVVVNRSRRVEPGDIVVAGIPGDEATVKRWRPRGAMTELLPSNPTMEPIRVPTSEVRIYGRVVAVLRRI